MNELKRDGNVWLNWPRVFERQRWPDKPTRFAKRRGFWTKRGHIRGRA